MYVLSVQYSCAVVSVFLFGGKANLTLATLFYSTLLALTDRQTDRQRVKYTRFAWAGGTFFPVVLLYQFFILAGNRFWLYILLCTQSSIQLWCCASFFGSGGKQFLLLRRYLVYNTVARLCHFFCCGGKVNFVPIFLLNQNFLLVYRKFSSHTYAIIPQK